MNRIRCVVFRGLPKEVEEDLGKFLEATPCHLHHVVQSESSDHVTITVLYEIDPEEH